MQLALIQDTVVKNIVTANSDQDVYTMSQGYDLSIDITAANPQPQVGWVLDGNQLVPGPGQSAVPSMKITKLAMLQRFTVPERIGILTYINSNPASVPAVLMQNINVATYVDLNRPDTQAGINYLVTFSLLTQARATQILTTAPTTYEVYSG